MKDLPSDPEGVLTPEERSELYASLERMHKARRAAEVESANMEMK